MIGNYTWYVFVSDDLALLSKSVALIVGGVCNFENNNPYETKKTIHRSAE